MKIYTLTTIEYIKKDDNVDFPEFGEKCAHGYYTTLKDAFNAVNAVNFNRYNDKISMLLTNPKYVIVEAYNTGVHAYANERYVFENKNNKYVLIDEPIELNKVCNFAFS